MSGTKVSRCAVYTRKSTEHNLDLEFNSLHGQREACEAYIKSQMHEGWQLIPDAFDDGGISGAPLLRPHLQRLLSHSVTVPVDTVAISNCLLLSRSLISPSCLAQLLDK